MGTKERRTRERLETREKIIAAAREMFAEEGYESVTMRSIAKRIEYTSTAIYHHFPGKQALLTELCERDFSGLAQMFLSSSMPADPIARLRAVGEAYLQFAEQYPSQYRFMFMTVLPEESIAEHLAQEDHSGPEKNAYVFLRAACVDAIQQQQLRPEITDPDQVAQVLWGAIHGLISIRMVKCHASFIPWADLRVTARLAIDAVLNGIVRPASP